MTLNLPAAMNKTQAKRHQMNTIQRGSPERSFDRTREVVGSALRAQFKAKKGGDMGPGGPYIRDISASRVVFEHGGKLMACKYTHGKGGDVSLGPEYVVEPDYIPVGKAAKGFEDTDGD